MRPISIRTLQPRAEITVHTTRGEVYTYQDLAADAISLELQRATDGSAGAFALTLTARAYKDGTWADRIQPMDYVEIRAGNLSPSSYPLGKLPMRFRGFVDHSAQTFSIPSSGGPQRSVVISGRDYTKLWQVSQVQYLWTINLPAALTAATGFGLSSNYGVPPDVSTVSQLVNAVVQHVFEGDGPPTTSSPFAPLFRQQGVDIPDPVVAVSVPDRYEINLLSVEPYTGSVWNLVQYFQSAPFGEAFFYDAEAGPVLVVRVAPFKDLSGNFVEPAVDPATIEHQLGPVTLDPSLISEQQIEFSDDEVLNYFFVYADQANMGAGSAYAYVSPGNFSPYNAQGNPQWLADSTAKFGFRPLNVQSPWVAAITQTQYYAQNAAELAYYLALTQGHNEQLRSGTIVCHGSEDLIPGRYITVPYGEKTGLSFYLESVTETFLFKGAQNPSWTAELGVTRGQDVTL